jgi:hypothetical protein
MGLEDSQAFSFIPVIDNDIDSALQEQCLKFDIDITNLEEVRNRMVIVSKPGHIVWMVDGKKILEIIRCIGSPDEIVYRIKKSPISSIVLINGRD